MLTGESMHPERSLLLIAEAAMLLIVARILIAFMPFPTLASRAVTKGNSELTLTPERLAAADRIRAAIRRAARSWAVCLPQALAANWMLHRRGIESTVCLGVRRNPTGGRMDAHAWLRVGQSILIGGPQAEGFQLVAELPVRLNSRGTST
jgi:hypothetical protein